MFRRLTGLAGAFLLLLSTAQADLNIRGFLKTYAGINTHQTDQWERLNSHLQLQFSGRTGHRIAYRADLVARYNFLADRHALASRSAGLELYPAEVYVDYYGNRLDIRIGQQYLFWGRADWVNPTDVFNPWDYANMSSDLEDYRIPIPAAKFSFYPKTGHLEVIYAPRLIPDKIPNPLSPSVGDSSLDQAQFGLRYANDLSAVAWSFYAYHGWRKRPEIKTLQFPEPPLLTYRKLDMIGADFIYTGEKWAVKGEGAFNFSEDRAGDDPYTANDNFYGVLGGDWIPGDDFSLNLQGIVRHYFDYNPSQDTQALATQELTDVIAVPEGTSFSASSVIRYKLYKYIDLQCIGVFNLDRKDWFWLGFVSWEMADATHLTLGGMFFDGPRGSEFGNSSQADQVFIQLKTSF